MAGKMKALQMWCKKNTAGYRDVNVVNMTTSWRDGLAFCALIHRYRPDLIDFDSLSKENILQNNQLAFQTAENELGIAALLDAEDMLAMKVPDKLSIITYVSQYYNCLHKMQPADDKSLKRISSPADISDQVETKRKPVPLTTNTKLPSSPPSVLIEKKQTFSSCEICKEKVHLVERYIDEGKVYHRQCHRTRSLSGMYQRDKALFHESNSTNHTTNPFKTAVPEKHPVGSSISSNQSPRNAANDSPKRKSKVLDMAMAYDKNGSSKTFVDEINPVITNQSPDIPEETSRKAKNSPHQMRASTPCSTAKDLPADINTAVENTLETSRTESAANGRTHPNKPAISGCKTLSNPTSTAVDEVSKAKPSAQTKESLPSLLNSLADAKQRDVAKSRESSADRSDGSSAIKIPPLVSELPMHPKAKPRSRASSTDELVSKEIPKAKPRSSASSFGSESDHGKSADETRKSVGRDGDNSSNITTETEPSSIHKSSKPKEDLNSFSEEPLDSEKVNSAKSASTDKTVSKLSTTFTTEGERLSKAEETSLESSDVKSRTLTLNTLSPKDTRLNPFTDAYEQKKQPETFPIPPDRKKGNVSETTSPKTSDDTNSAKHSASPKSPLESPNHCRTKPVKFPFPSSRSEENNATSPEVNQQGATNSNPIKEQPKVQKAKADNSIIKKQVKKTRDKLVQPPIASNQNKTTSTKGHISEVKQTDQKPPLKPARRAPGFGFPLVKRRVKNQMTEEEISSEMAILDIQLKDLEKKGVKLEEVLRDEMELGSELKKESDQMLGEWFELVHEKNKLVRRETDLVFLMQQQRLEQEHADVEFKIRKLLNKPDAEKSDQEKEEETKLLAQLLQIVERRNTIINSIEEERVKEEEEDAAYDKMKMLQIDSSNDSEATKKKKKNKVKKIFSKRRKSAKSSKEATSTSPK